MQTLASEGSGIHCSVLKVQTESAKNQIEAQRSGFDLKRRRSEMSEFSPRAETNDMELVPATCAFSSAGRATDS